MKTHPRLALAILPFSLLATLFLVYFGAWNPGALTAVFSTALVDNPFVDARLKYQLASLAIALCLLGLAYLFARPNARLFYRPGEIAAPAGAVRWLGIQATDTWKTVGRNFAIIISLATAAFVYLNVARGQTIEGEHLKYLPFILLFSLTNAFSEEAITRLSLVTALKGQIDERWIALASALLFGIPHYFGVPGGWLGSLMAGFLGWLLARSILETRGFAWAWFLHFLQDVIIFTALFWAAL